ncbi:hypothetical protein [Rhodobacter sp. CZR27]|uniref:hypothetical protein n=1 Tax=Rhodobacter sp. CZR27 TaxID=2033869 RepID=UPI0012FDCE0D|nr:hypothetical protein [Rhodobacter sp. CZR27]
MSRKKVEMPGLRQRNPEITSAIISAVVALAIAVPSAAFTFWKNITILQTIRSETRVRDLSSARTQRFLNRHDAYVTAYREFESKVRETKKSEDGFVRRLNLITDLYAKHSRDLVELYSDYISDEVVGLKTRLQDGIDKHAQSPSIENAMAFHKDGLKFHELLARDLVKQ